MFPPEAEKKKLEILRSLKGTDRLKAGLGLSSLARKMMDAGIRQQFPSINDQEYRRQVALRIGHE